MVNNLFAKKRSFGWVKDRYDSRDLIHLVKKKIPDRVILSPVPEAGDQGQEGSCVGWGVGGSLTALAGNKILEWFSPRDVYNGAKFIGGYLDSEGAYPADAYKWVIRKSGGCLLWSLWPYIANKDSFKAPSLTFDVEREKYPILSYYRVTSGINGIISALANKHFVSLGSPWFSKWMSTDKNGVLKRVSVKDSITGGHETYLFGYDKKLQEVYGMNSWGLGWSPFADGGYRMRFDSFDVMKAVQGYDAHYVTVNW